MSIPTHRENGLLETVRQVVVLSLPIWLVCFSIAAPALVLAQTSYAVGDLGGMPGGSLVGVQTGDAISVSIGIGGLSLSLGRQRNVSPKARKEKKQRTSRVGHLQKPDIAAKFPVYADMGIDPKLMAKVRADPEGTIRQYRNILRNAKEHGNLEQQKNAAIYFGNVCYLLGLFREAKASYSDALNLYRVFNDINGQALIANNLGAVAAASRNYDQALRYYGDALLKFKATDNQAGQSMVLNNLGALAKIGGRFSRDVRRLKESFDRASKAGKARALKPERRRRSAPR